MIYLDNNATTRPDPAMVEVMLPFLTEDYGNPSSPYGFGTRAANAIRHAREQVANLLGCEPREIVFTSCATESNNAAFASALRLAGNRRHIVTTSVEHSSVSKPCTFFSKQGYEVTMLPVNALGQMDLHELERSIRPDTALLSAQWANNETGVIFPIEEMAGIARSKGVLFHSDAVQAAGKIRMDIGAFGLNFLSLSGHKFHGPKGVGVLYVNRRTRFHPSLLGGGQENERRAGTENVAGIAGMGKASEIAARQLEAGDSPVQALRDRFEKAVLARIPGTEVNGDPLQRLPNTSNLAFSDVESEGLVMLLDKAGICCSAGSACSSGSLQPSHVLRAMGFSSERAKGSVRFSFSRFNNEVEITTAVDEVCRAVEKLRGVASAA